MQLTSNEWMQKAGEFEAEIDRLQRGLQDAQLRALKAEAEVESYRKTCLDLGEEVERLRGAEERLTVLNEQLANRHIELDAEVERLREEKEFWLHKTDQLAAEVRERYKPAEARLRRIEEALDRAPRGVGDDGPWLEWWREIEELRRGHA